MQADLFFFSVRNLNGERHIQIGGSTREVTPVYEAYWRFAAERQAVFLRRLNGAISITTDPILARFKFTNAYRILDRTTQFLLREVILKGD